MNAVFIDRDGVINENRNDYVKTAEEFVIIPKALDGLSRLRASGIITIVVSNQAGVGRGLIAIAELDRINQKMIETVTAHGGCITDLYYCPHDKDAGCDCRKPGTGMFRRAAREYGIDLAGSYFIGDAKTDVEAGLSAGCKTVLVLTGRTAINDVDDWEFMPDHIAPDLPAAVDWILTKQGHCCPK